MTVAACPAAGCAATTAGEPAVLCCWLLLALWVLAVNLVVLLPYHRRQQAGWGLIVLGVPLVGLATWQHGPIVGLLVMGLGIAMLRWPPVLWLPSRLPAGVRRLLRRGARSGGKAPTDPQV